MVVFHLVDVAEEEFPYGAPGVFEDGESGMRVPLRPEEMRERYLRMFGAHREALVKRFSASGVDYIPLRTDQPLDMALHLFLDRRLSQGRVR